MEGRVRVEVHPTESLEKVVKAVQAVMGEIELQESDRGPITILEGRLEKMDDLLPLRDLFSR
ncbi:MAG: RNA-binding domain-containing protein, partial [Candidatus Bathyarchaeia archaeon]